MSTFYTYKEVAIAESLLFDMTKSVIVDYLPGFTEHKGTNRLCATFDYLLGMFISLYISKWT